MKAKNNKISIINTSFGERLKNLRKNRGLSQAEFAEKLEYKQNTSVSNIEKGKSVPDLETLNKIADVLEVDLHWLVTGKQSPSTKEVINLFVKATKKFAPYLGDHLTRLFEQKIILLEKQETLSAIPDLNSQDKAELEQTNKDLEKLTQFIDETLQVMNFLQNPLDTEKEKE